MFHSVNIGSFFHRNASTLSSCQFCVQQHLSQIPCFALFSGCLTYLTAVWPPCKLPPAPKKGGTYLSHFHTLGWLGNWQGIPLLFPEVSSSLAGVGTGDFTGFKALLMVWLLRRGTNGTSSQGEICFCYEYGFLCNK